MITEKQILEALSHVDDPDLNKDLVTLKMIENISINELEVKFDVVLTTPACPMKDMIKNACINAVKHFVDANAVVTPNMTAKVTTKRNKNEALPLVKNIVAVTSGKGGVGKSTISANLAKKLAQLGASVGVLDADIYGPSIPVLFSCDEKPKSADGKMQPILVDGVKIMSIGFLVKKEQPIVWKGPMLSTAIKQLINDVNWGELDYLIIDLPPGTGDAQLTIVQSLPLTGVIAVTTPGELSIADCRKAIGMFAIPGIKTPVLGLVENMSWFSPPESEMQYKIFGDIGAKELADEWEIEVLEHIPIFLPSEKDKLYNHFLNLAERTAQKIAVLNNK